MARRGRAVPAHAQDAHVRAHRRHRRRRDNFVAGAAGRRAQLGLPILLVAARDWRHWLLRAIAGDPAELQIMYGVAGERRLDEYVAEWLPGYDGNPVRIGNA